ncbi:MAG TPA: MoaD/ThiS family protein [Opitutaceae bacterium]|nr:MoaD/ThiS family protein [Opitutaceae bacterium]
MRVLFFGHLKTLAGCSVHELPADELSSDELWALLLTRFPAFAPLHAHTRLACNSEFAPPGARFTSADEIALIPPVSGG